MLKWLHSCGFSVIFQSSTFKSVWRPSPFGNPMVFWRDSLYSKFEFPTLDIGTDESDPPRVSCLQRLGCFNPVDLLSPLESVRRMRLMIIKSWLNFNHWSTFNEAVQCNYIIRISTRWSMFIFSQTYWKRYCLISAFTESFCHFYGLLTRWLQSFQMIHWIESSGFTISKLSNRILQLSW